MADIQIELKFNQADFEEIYFKDNQANIFFSKSTKGHFFILLTFITSLLVLLTYCLWSNSSWIGLVVLFFVCVIALFSFFHKASPIIKWRKNVKSYLTELSKYNRYKLILTETAIAVIMDNVERIEKWSAIQEANITDEFISLTSTHNYLFPRKSMPDTDYRQLKTFVSERVKNGL